MRALAGRGILAMQNPNAAGHRPKPTETACLLGKPPAIHKITTKLCRTAMHGTQGCVALAWIALCVRRDYLLLIKKRKPLLL
jgi:hypothetical protein